MIKECPATLRAKKYVIVAATRTAPFRAVEQTFAPRSFSRFTTYWPGRPYRLAEHYGLLLAGMEKRRDRRRSELVEEPDDVGEIDAIVGVVVEGLMATFVSITAEA